MTLIKRNQNNLIDIVLHQRKCKESNKISEMLKNKHNKNYLNKFNCKGKKNTYCCVNWDRHTVLCSVSKILLKTFLIRHLISKNNLGLPNEIWEMICNFVENDVKFYVPVFIEFNNDINMHFGNRERCINLGEILKNDYDLVMNSIKFLKYVNLGDIIVKGRNRHSYCLSIIVNIDVKFGLITVINENNMCNHYFTFRKSKIINTSDDTTTFDFKKPISSRTFYFYELFMNTVGSNVKVYIFKTHL